MKQIPLTKGKFALVDDDKFEEISLYKWHFTHDPTGKGYARRSEKIIVGPKRGTYRCVYMHRQLLTTHLEVDHINGNRLDNRMCNLREADRVLQARNRSASLRSSSKYLGVHYNKINKNWRAQINVTGKIKDLGSFLTQEEANNARLAYIDHNNLKGFRK
jgi:hypothetical protein